MSRRRRRLGRLAVALVVVLALVFAGVLLLGGRTESPRPACTVTATGRSVRLELDRAANAATIAAVGQLRGMPDHAVTVALATALQESKLDNLPYGDLDSVGLFQQRPSQGWGTPEQLLDPTYAAGAFFDHLVKVPGWQTLSVADAAQAVQRSADGSAYASWEPTARALASALTGEEPHALACSYPAASPSPAGLGPALAAQRGPHAVGVPVAPTTGWATASWLVAHAARYGVVSVTFDGQTWTRASGRWTPTPPATREVSYRLASAP